MALAGGVHLAELKPLGHQKGVGGDAQRGVMVKPAPAPSAANVTSTAWRVRSRCARTNLRLVTYRRARRATGSTPDSAAMPRCLREACTHGKGTGRGHGKVAGRDSVAKPANIASKREWNPDLNLAQKTGWASKIAWRFISHVVVVLKV